MPRTMDNHTEAIQFSMCSVGRDDWRDLRLYGNPRETGATIGRQSEKEEEGDGVDVEQGDEEEDVEDDEGVREGEDVATPRAA
jgi:hypothetical protein